LMARFFPGTAKKAATEHRHDSFFVHFMTHISYFKELSCPM
jgi:hypothetical protein